MSEKKRLSQIVETTNIDYETGVVKNESRITVFQAGREPDYVKLYLKDIALVNDLPKGDTNILFHLAAKMDYEGTVVLISATKKLIATALGISEAAVKKAILGLSNRKILIRVDRGLYKMNPYLFGKGDWKNVQKIRLTIEYSAQGRVITSEISEQMEMDFDEERAALTSETTKENHFASIVKKQMEASEKKKERILEQV